MLSDSSLLWRQMFTSREHRGSSCLSRPKRWQICRAYFFSKLPSDDLFVRLNVRKTDTVWYDSGMYQLSCHICFELINFPVSAIIQLINITDTVSVIVAKNDYVFKFLEMMHHVYNDGDGKTWEIMIVRVVIDNSCAV